MFPSPTLSTPMLSGTSVLGEEANVLLISVLAFGGVFGSGGGLGVAEISISSV
jgi:hypothetical protein